MSREQGKKIEYNSQPRKILLVEDNRVSRLVVERLLIRWGYSVAVAAHGLAGLKLAAQDSFDLILMNVQMPGMSGRETTRLIRRLGKHYQRMPIIGFSSNGDLLAQCPEPFTDFLEVPFVPEKLKNMLEFHLPAAKSAEGFFGIDERLQKISGGDDTYRRQLASLFIKNCAEIQEDLQMGRLESPSYLSQVRHKHKSSLRLLELFSLEVALDNLQEALNAQKYDQQLLAFRKQAVSQQLSAVMDEFRLVYAA
jgi:CheY-like chemotaxis protein